MATKTPLQNKITHKEPLGTAEKTVANAGTRDCITAFGARIPAGGTAVITQYEWDNRITAGEKTAFQLS